MTNDELLLQKNIKLSKCRLNIENGMLIYKIKEKTFNYDVLKKIIAFLNYLNDKYKKVNLPIVFELGNIQFVDKLIYTIFECVCNVLITKWERNVYVQFSNKDTIWTAGVESSPMLLLTTGEKKHIIKFQDKFQKEIYHNHYRRVVKGNKKEESNYLCKIMTDIEIFLKTFLVSKQCRDDISEVIVELIGNAEEHTLSDCLIDLDVSPGYSKKDSEGKYYGINIAIINFSDKLLGDGLKSKLFSSDAVLDDRHSQLINAYDLHSKNFSDFYNEDDFFNVASFQHRISERKQSEYTGGTGLTKLIHSLEVQSDAHRCYVISGERRLLFHKEYLEYNDDNWIGFNKEKDFLGHIPHRINIEKTSIYFPGTAYNLNFVMKEDETNG